ncbi:hypothetical protein [Streptomyces sp. NBC_01481]|uniref:hypothetical protein n=1 Tax=Streptomyces sp. NBC_01481 TaxID=2975869 RepID=UPI0022591A57|nr:hypothetical protein [Streptomyces sp. NBC_01481]MCX4586158.1 hypothetical protein [Streptomyces sp. NBC_01481]
MVRRHQALRTPLAAGLVGIIFALLLSAAIILVRLTLPDPGEASGDWFSDASRRRTVQTALGLIPFAGIFFLWFMGAVRARIGDAEDKFVATVFLGSGLLFVATLFGAAAAAGSLLAAAGASGAGSGPQLQSFGQHFTYGLLTTYSMRMAAVFTLSTSSIGHQLGVLPRWLSILGYLVALTLLFVTDSIAWSELVFPLWALVVSLHILVAGLRRRSASVSSA